MALSCGIFWDMQNISVPKGSSIGKIFSLIDSNIIYPFKLTKTGVYVVHDDTLTELQKSDLSKNHIKFRAQVHHKSHQNAADELLMDYIEEWFNSHHRGVIILLSGDGDFVTFLKRVQMLYDASIYLICLAESFSEKYFNIADRIFVLEKDQLEPLYTSDRAWHPNHIKSSIDQEKDLETLIYKMKRQLCVKIGCSDNLPLNSLDYIKTDLRSYKAFCSVFYDNHVWASFDHVDEAKSVFSMEGCYTFNGERYWILTRIVSPPQAVINLMICALFKHEGVKYIADTKFVMVNYKSKN